MNRFFLSLLLGLTLAPVAQAQIRIPVAKATSGLPLAVTHDYDRIVQFEGDRIVDAWLSNPVLFNPRFTKGGNVLVIQSNGSSKELRILPQLGRTLATLTIELQSGRVAVFYLNYTPHPPKQTILTLFGPSTEPLLRPALAAYQERSSVVRPPVGRVTQQGFTPPFKALQTQELDHGSSQNIPTPLSPVVSPSAVGEDPTRSSTPAQEHDHETP